MRRCISILLLPLLLPLAPLHARADDQTNRPTKSPHWAFQPARMPMIPTVHDAEWCQTIVDRFVLAKLEAVGLRPARPADRRSLIRRVSFDLNGLPPTAAEIEAFVQDTSPDAFVRVVDRMLHSVHYGERWGRYWLDVARYADTKGYIFTEERAFPYSYTYRDWVIRALNEDLPFDRFLLRQIAADLLPPAETDKSELAALGFLTLGRRFLGNTNDIIDDRIDVVTRGTMALTVQCARCHDHKYDPIPTADYYSLYGVFASCSEKQIPIAPASDEFEREVQARDTELEQFIQKTLDTTLHKLRSQVSDYLLAAESLKDHPDIMDFMFVDNPGEVNRYVLGRWRTYLELKSKRNDAIWAPWFAFAALPESEFSARAPTLSARFAGSATAPAGGNAINRRVAKLFEAAAPTSIREVAVRYGRLFAEVEGAWMQRLAAVRASNAPPPSRLDDAELEELRHVLYGEGSPTAVPRRNIDDLFEKPDADKLRALRKKLQEYRTSPKAPPNAMALVDNETPSNPFIFVRGNPGNHGPEVPRQFPAVVAGVNRGPFRSGSGRLELARAIVDTDNPLTARTIVNRVWLHHFGAGFVTTPSDLGTRSEPPSHPELFDWLARWFVDSGWSLKKLHRMILLSSVYQQSSVEVAQPAPTRPDPDNRLLWRQNRRRLDFESMRDALLTVSGNLDRRVGGRPVDLATHPYSTRRTVYGFIERQNLPGMFRTFDFASPDTHCPNRFTTVVPQQALFLMNSPFVVEQARRLIARADMQAEFDPGLRVQRLHRHVFGRAATDPDVSLALQFIESSAATARATASDALSRWEQYAQVLLLSNEFIFVD